MSEETIVIVPEEAYKNRYRIRKTGSKGASYETTIPKHVIEREARIRGMTVDEFIENYMAEISYNSFRGIHLDFVPVPQKDLSNERNPSAPPAVEQQ